MFFSFGSLRSAFVARSQRLPLVQALWQKPSPHNSINSGSTLPLEIASKDTLYLQVEGENPGQGALKLKTKQSVAYAKQLLRFYKHGVSVVWRNQQKSRKMVRSELALERYVDRHGKTTAVQIPSFRVLTKTMAQRIYTSLVEEKSSRPEDNFVVHNVVLGSDKNGLFGISRDTYQLLRRTPGDFIKIPGFAVIFTVFMEMTPVLCYAFPEITPSTCVLPSLLPRIWPKKNMDRLRAVDVKMAETDYALRTAHNIPLDHLHLLCTTLRLKSKYVPSVFYPEKVLRERLQDYYNYLCVDNYFLSGLNGDGNVWDLSTQECVLASLERNLVPDLPNLVKTLSTGTISEREDAVFDLKAALFKFIVDFSTSNVGYLVLAPRLIEKSAVKQWRT